jgi:hypothetical protein
MKLKHITLIAASTFGILLMQGCAAVPSENLKRTYTPTYHSPSITDLPAVGEIKTVEVGESLVSKDKQTSIPAIDIEQAIELPAENLGVKFMLTALSGRYVEKGKDASGKYYEAKDGKFLENGKPTNIRQGIYVTDSDPQKTEFYALTKNSVPLSYPKNGIPFTKSVQQTRDELSFRKELVYTGIAQNIVSILYREFKDDTARPAFSQDLKYDLTESKVVGYRGARFEIIKATNQGLTYKTLKQLD